MLALSLRQASRHFVRMRSAVWAQRNIRAISDLG
jgi:hypothetical protein